MLKSLSIFCLAIILSGCGVTNYAGLARFDIDWCEAGERFQICRVRVIEGKEKASIKVTVTFPDGSTLIYEATDVKSFEGQALRADVQRALVEQLGEVAPGVVDAIVKAILGRPPGS